MRTKHTHRLTSDLALKLADHANLKRIPQARIVETTMPLYLSPDALDHLDAVPVRRQGWSQDFVGRDARTLVSGS